MARFSISLDSNAAANLVARVLEHARGRGVSQARLARRTGITAEALSRLKKGGRCRLSTALALARAAGLNKLEISGDPPVGSAATIAARALSSGRRVPITAEQLILALESSEPPREHSAHLYGFFEELPVESVHDVILDEGLDYARLLSLAGALAAEGETVEWLAEMARDSVAGVARVGPAAAR